MLFVARTYTSCSLTFVMLGTASLHVVLSKLYSMVISSPSTPLAVAAGFRASPSYFFVTSLPLGHTSSMSSLAVTVRVPLTAVTQ